MFYRIDHSTHNWLPAECSWECNLNVRFRRPILHFDAIRETELGLIVVPGTRWQNPFCTLPVWLDWAIYCTLGNFSKPVATIILPKLPTFIGNSCKGVKSFIFLVKSFLGNFYRHLSTFYWSCCQCDQMLESKFTHIFHHWPKKKPK